MRARHPVFAPVSAQSHDVCWQRVSGKMIKRDISLLCVFRVLRSLRVGGFLIPSFASVCNLDVIFDADINLQMRIGKLWQLSSVHLRNMTGINISSRSKLPWRIQELLKAVE